MTSINSTVEFLILRAIISEIAFSGLALSATFFGDVTALTMRVSRSATAVFIRQCDFGVFDARTNPGGVNIHVDPPGNVDINAFDRRTGRSALHAACKRRNFDVVNYLLSHNANVALRDSKHRTPFHMICEYAEGHDASLEVARKVLETVRAKAAGGGENVEQYLSAADQKG